jgi:ABC-type amino acid transport substrate-binding protein
MKRISLINSLQNLPRSASGLRLLAAGFPAPSLLTQGFLTFSILLMTSAPFALAQDETPAATATLVVAESTIPEIAPPATTLERIGANGTLRFGYRADAQPFSFRDESGQPAGYSVALCGKIAEQVKTTLALPSLAVEWVPVTLESRFADLSAGKVDLLCGADTATLTRRQDVSFSIPIFPGGIGAVVHADAPARLKLVLEGRPLPNEPLWRGRPAEVLQHKTFSAVAGTTTETWLAGRINTLGIIATQSPVETYDAGVELALDRHTDALFGDRAILLAAVKRSRAADELIVLERRFTLEPIALALARGDEDFRLLVDRTLSQLYATGEFAQLFTGLFGEPDENMLLFFRVSALPE